MSAELPADVTAAYSAWRNSERMRPLPAEAIGPREAFAAGWNAADAIAGRAAADARREYAAELTRTHEQEVIEWQWADPIADRYTIRSPRESGGCFLHCTACDADLFSVGEMDLWEFALDAKRHDLEKHADLLADTPGGAT